MSRYIKKTDLLKDYLIFFMNRNNITSTQELNAQRKKFFYQIGFDISQILFYINIQDLSEIFQKKFSMDYMNFEEFLQFIRNINAKGRNISNSKEYYDLYTKNINNPEWSKVPPFPYLFYGQDWKKAGWYGVVYQDLSEEYVERVLNYIRKNNYISLAQLKGVYAGNSHQPVLVMMKRYPFFAQKVREVILENRRNIKSQFKEHEKKKYYDYNEIIKKLMDNLIYTEKMFIMWRAQQKDPMIPEKMNVYPEWKSWNVWARLLLKKLNK